MHQGSQIHNLPFQMTASDSSFEEQAQNEAGRVQLAKLSALGKMAGSIAHEINNPLSVIRMNAEIALEYSRHPEKTEKLYEKCQKIIATADKISGIIRALKSISASYGKPSLEWIELSRVLDDVYDLCSPRFKIANVPLIIDYTNIKDVRFFIDPAQISLALINLLNNSFDAIKHLEERWVRVFCTVTQDHLSITVVDSGLGIPSHMLSEILNPFYSTKKNHDSLGIGLNLVQSYASCHHGTLNYSLVDSHTAFTLELPLSTVNPTTCSSQ